MKKMIWSEISDPTEGVSFFTHTICESPIGRIIIEWRGWRELPDDYDVSINGDIFISYSVTLEDAKEKAKEYLENKYNELKIFLEKIITALETDDGVNDGVAHKYIDVKIVMANLFGAMEAAGLNEHPKQ